MRLKFALASATALGLMMGGAAWANSNDAHVTQTGDNNTAQVTQDGDDNLSSIDQVGDQNRSVTRQVGDDNTAEVTQDGLLNTAGRTSYQDQLRQTGNNNLMTIDQVGTRNRVGTNFVTGMQQNSDRNELAIEQSTTHSTNSVNGNRIWRVNQTGTDGASSTTNRAQISQSGYSPLDTTNRRSTNFVHTLTQIHGGGAMNEIVINQQSEEDTWHGGRFGNVVGNVTQDGSANSVSINQEGNPFFHSSNGRLIGAENHVTDVLQNGDGNSSDLNQDGRLNVISLVLQLGDNHTAGVSQTGFGNEVASVTQDNTGSGSVGNTAVLSFDGDFNGVGTFSGVAADLGLAQSTVVQLGDDNSLTYDVLGNNNLFAFDQVGDGNSIEGSVVGDDNQVAVAQSGGMNYSFTQQHGNNNNISISQ